MKWLRQWYSASVVATSWLVATAASAGGIRSRRTADAQSEVPVLTVPAGGAKNLLTQNASKRKGSADERLETLCKDKKRKAIGVRTSFDGEDKQVVMEVYDQLNSKYSSCLVRVLHIELLLLPALLQHRMYIQTSVTASDSRSLFSWQGTTQGGRPLSSCSKKTQSHSV